jgi:hypothetical protein
MTHEDYFQQYVAIREKEVRALNETMRNRLDREFHWAADFPYGTADLSNCDGLLEAKVMAVKFPVTPHSGILIMPDEDPEYYEVGYTDLLFGDIDAILDALPEDN